MQVFQMSKFLQGRTSLLTWSWKRDKPYGGGGGGGGGVLPEVALLVQVSAKLHQPTNTAPFCPFEIISGTFLSSSSSCFLFCPCWFPWSSDSAASAAPAGNKNIDYNMREDWDQSKCQVIHGGGWGGVGGMWLPTTASMGYVRTIE